MAAPYFFATKAYLIRLSIKLFTNHPYLVTAYVKLCTMQYTIPTFTL